MFKPLWFIWYRWETSYSVEVVAARSPKQFARMGMDGKNAQSVVGVCLFVGEVKLAIKLG